MKMRRVLSLVLVTAMLLSAAVFTAPAASAVDDIESVLDWGNSYAIAHYFPGYVEYYETSGPTGKVQEMKASEECETIKYEDVKDEDVYLMLDGSIDEEEWGAPALSISSKYATHSLGERNNNQALGRHPDYDWPSAENTYFHYLSNDKKFSNGDPYELSFDAWFMWDEQFLYVAVKTLDLDGHANKKDMKSSEDPWNGDAVQLRIDPLGPNSAVDGKGYDATKYTYDADDTDRTTKVYPRPWKNVTYNRSGEQYSEIPNFVIAMVEGINGTRSFVDRWDAARRYNPHPDEKDPAKTIYDEANVADGVNDSSRDIKFSPVFAAATSDLYQTSGSHPIPVDPTNGTTQLKWACESQYEIAIPWQYLDTSEETLASHKYFKPEAGMALGMALTLLNAFRNGTSYSSFLEWGNGITGTIFSNDGRVAGGSNALILSDMRFDEQDEPCEHNFAEPTCEAGYKCTICGYERGHKLGHSYSFNDGHYADGEGGLTAVCDRCNDTVVKAFEDIKYTNVASFMTTDISTEGNGFLPAEFNSGDDENYKSGWTKPWKYHADGDKHGDYVWVNGRTRTAYDDKTFPGEAVADLTQLNFTGTALYGQGFSDMLSFSYKMEVNIKSYNPAIENQPYDYNANNSHSDPYSAGIYVVYGGDEASSYSEFQAGLYYMEDTGAYYFAILRNGSGQGGKIRTEAQLKEKALAYSRLSDEKAAKVKNDWHELRISYEDSTSTTYVLWDNELMVCGYSPFMTYNRPDKQNSCVARTFDLAFYARNVEIQRLKSKDISPLPEEPEPSTFTATINGVTGEYAKDEVVSTGAADAVKVVNGYAYRFTGWTGDVEFADATSYETTFVMPDHDVSVEATYNILIGDANNDGVIDSSDVLSVSRIAAGAAAAVPAADIDNDGDVGPADLVAMKRYVVGRFIPSK